MESKKLFEELFEEEDIEEYAGATKKECHNWYQSVIGGCYGTGIHAHYDIYIAVTHQDINWKDYK